MRPVAVSSLLLLLSTGAWTVVLAVSDHPFSGTAVVLMAVSLWVVTVASLSGMLVSGSRWARRTGLVVTLAHAVLAVALPTGTAWLVALALSGITAVALSGPWLATTVRGRPNASGPPTRAVLVPLVLVAAPLLIGLANGEGAAAVVAGLGSLLVAFWFVRTLPFALSLVRVVWPVIAIACAFGLPWLVAVATVVPALAAAALAWHPSVTRAVIPLVESGSIVAIPPELTPPEILDAAQLDDRGRPT